MIACLGSAVSDADGETFGIMDYIQNGRLDFKISGSARCLLESYSGACLLSALMKPPPLGGGYHAAAMQDTPKASGTVCGNLECRRLIVPAFAAGFGWH